MAPSRTKRQQAPVTVSTRMSLRSCRNVPLVPMETSSSSSDDSCDSFGSDCFSNTKKPYTRARVMAKMSKASSDEETSDGFAAKEVTSKPYTRARVTAKMSKVSSDEETSDGFAAKEVTSGMETMRVESDSEDSEPLRRVRRPQPLKVALKFPVRKTVPKKAPPTEAVPGAKDPESDSEEGGSFLQKRALNVRENKAMLAKLMAELNKVSGLMPRRTSLPGVNTPRRPPRCPAGAPAVRRRNPKRSSRMHTRSCSLVDGPPSPPPEEDPEDRFSLVRRSRYYEEEEEWEPRRRSYGGMTAILHVVRPVEDITQLELDNICVNVRDKVYDRSTGSTCHQCRQKTRDTKTNCRNPECVGVRGQFCGPCLRNRYGEEVGDALLDAEWRCPPCRGICNCSFCRAREGRCATGVLVYLAKYHGYDNVHAYLLSLKRELEASQ